MRPVLCFVSIVMVLAVAGMSFGFGDSNKKEYIKVEIYGELKSGVMAIGGETTGWEITANDLTFEVEFSSTKLQEQSEVMAGTKRTITGTLRKVRTPERGDRLIIRVTELK